MGWIERGRRGGVAAGCYYNTRRRDWGGSCALPESGVGLPKVILGLGVGGWHWWDLGG